MARVVRRLAILPQMLEDVDQRSFAELSRAARRHPQCPARARDEPCSLERTLHLLQPLQIADRVLTERSAQPFLVDVLQGRARIIRAHGAVQVLVVGQSLERVHRRLHRHGLLAASQRRVVPRKVGEPLGERAGEAIHLERQVEVLQDLASERLELGPVLGRHRGEEARECRHPAGHLLQQLVQRPRALREEVTMALHEALEVDGFSPGLGVHHRVELGQHVLEPVQLLGRKASHPGGHLPEVRAHDLLAEPLEQFVERGLRRRVGEPVLAQLADRAGRIGRERVQKLFAEPRVVVRAERERAALGLKDLPESVLHLPQRAVQVEPRLLAPACVAKAGAQGVQTGEPSTHAPPHEAGERLIGTLAGEQLVGDRLEEVARGEVRPQGVLGAVPRGISKTHATSLPFPRPADRPQ